MMECIIYIHGKGGNAEEAEHFRRICEGCEVVGLDYHGTTPWETKEEILSAYESLSGRFRNISVIANSIRAYFCMNALHDVEIKRGFLISPVADMEKLIIGMMNFAGVAESELESKGEIDTSFGEKLSWEYLCYVSNNPINWTAPTWILYGENDVLIPFEAVKDFAEKHSAELTVMPGGSISFTRMNR